VRTDTPLAVMAIPGVHEAVADGDEVAFAVDGADWTLVLQSLSMLRVHQLVANPPSLEQIFLSHYG